MFLHFDSLPVSIRPLQSFGCGEGGSGEGGGGEGGGGEGEGDGGSLQVFRHFWYFFLHSLLHCFFPAASTAPAKRNTEMKISISFIVSAHQGNGASDAGRFERKRAASSRPATPRLTNKPGCCGRLRCWKGKNATSLSCRELKGTSHTLGPSSRVVLPILLGGHALPVPHGSDPLLAASQRAARVLRPAVVHGLALVGAVEHVAEEEHLPRLGYHLEPGAREERVASLVGHLAVREARRQA
eukprot:scaffold65733_cov60-Phaeocystis_antarctica.AAC.5